MIYRKDIDGLRSLAILPVLLFHVGFERRVPGGFIGVDIFFVISGYLITGLINSDISNRRFSITNFYNRRIRRIFPALFAVYAACIVFGLLLLFPTELERLQKSTIASVLFVSNIFFFSQSSYFDQRLELNPLLHTWSLSVEEQFYVFFPLLMMLFGVLAAGWQRKAILACLCLLSFGWSVWMVTEDRSAAFYLVQFRAWELLLGALLALGTFPIVRNQLFAEFLGFSGVALIGYGLLAIDRGSEFPGALAAIPCIGCACIIYSGSHTQTLVSRVLSMKPLVLVGLISYSLYLWHWPIFVYWRIAFGLESVPSRGAALAVAFLFAAISYRYVEQPFRRPTFAWTPRKTVAAGAFAMLAMVCLSLPIESISRFAWKTPSDVDRLLAFEDYDAFATMRAGQCFLTSQNTIAFYKPETCLRVDPKRKNVLLMGDSHGAHLWPGMHGLYGETNVLQANASGCKPVLGSKGQARCTELFEKLIHSFLPGKKLDMIVVAARWDVQDLPQLKETVRFLREFSDIVLVLGPVPEYFGSLPRLVAKATTSGADAQRFANQFRKPDREALDKLLSSISWEKGVYYFSIHDALCRPLCAVQDSERTPLQFDYGHFTEEGSLLVASLVERYLADVRPDMRMN